jgi:Cys-rich protein (TIGR01571 family)
MYEKVVGPRGIYKKILCTFISLSLIVYATNSLYFQTGNAIYLGLYRLIVFITNMYGLIILVTIRKRIRKHYNIKETTCKGCEDVCCALWCFPFSSCQNARQIYKRENGSRNGGCTLTPTGDPTGEEEYLFEQ